MLQFFTKKRGEKGFTLIELLVVIAVIGMLASIVLVSLGPVRGKGRDARRIADIRQVATTLEMYYDDSEYKYYNTDDTDWDDGSNLEADATIKKYLDPLPTDPLDSGSNQYIYCADTTPTSSIDYQEYCIQADLEQAGFFKCSSKGCKETDSAGTACGVTGNKCDPE